MASTAKLRRLAKTVSRQPEWILALAATVAVVWLHFFFLLHAGGLWRDEVNLINLSGRHSLTEMSKDSFPVLMPLLVSGWTALGLGQDDLSLRLLGALIGLALPAALWLAAWKIRRAPPLIGLVLLAFNSTVIMFGDSLRAFGLGSVLILLTTAAAGWFLKSPTWRRAAVLATLTVLSVQALFQNAVFIAAICLGGWAVCARQKNRGMAVKILAVAAASAASLLPYWSRIVSLPAAASALRTGFNPRYVFTNFDNAAGFPMLQYTWVWGFFSLAVVVCGCASLFARARKADGLDGSSPAENAPLFGKTTLLMALAAVSGFFWFAATPAARWIFFPLMVVAIVVCDVWLERRSLTRREDGGDLQRAGPETGTPTGNDLPLFAGVTLLAAFVGFAGFLRFAALISEPWYFLPLLALAAAAFELGLPLASRHFRAAIFGFAAATIVLAIPAARIDLDQRFTNIDLVAQRLTKEAWPGDFIIVNPWFCGITFDRYYQGPALWNTLPPLKDHSTHRYDLVREQMQKRDAIQPVFDQITATLQSGHRVWIVGVMDIPKPGAPMPASLPPAPADYSGPELRYTQNWSSQVAQFLSNRSCQITRVDFAPSQNIAPENMKLIVASGWQASTSEATSHDAKTNAP
jgi:ABC-type multidrug transport system fused ATPase/permease subunit